VVAAINAIPYAKRLRYRQPLQGYRPIVPVSALAGRSVEAYLLTTDRMGVILVHMEGVQPASTRRSRGLPVISPIASVLRVAREMGHPTCALTQRNLPLVAPLRDPGWRRSPRSATS
jgi:hypothetical protein